MLEKEKLEKELKDFILEAVENVKNNGLSVWHYDFHCKENDLNLVIGSDSPSNYDKEDLENFLLDNEGWVVCWKLAINIDFLRCDFDSDWYEPFEKDTGEVYMTQTEFYKDYKDDLDTTIKDILWHLDNLKDCKINSKAEILKDDEFDDERHAPYTIYYYYKDFDFDSEEYNTWEEVKEAFDNAKRHLRRAKKIVIEGDWAEKLLEYTRGGEK